MSGSLMLGATGEGVATLHQRLVVLGIDVPSVERREDHFGAGTESAIRSFQARTGLPITGVVDDATALAIGLNGSHPRSIEGVVCRPDGTPLGGIAVRLYQQTLGGETIAGEILASSDGRFTLPWPDGIIAGLSVRAEDGADKVVSAAVKPGAATAWLRLSVGGEYRGASRFAALTAALASTLDNVPLGTIGSDGRVSELKAISETAGITAPDLSRLVLAHKLEAETKVDAAVFFALFAQRVPASLTAALARNGEQPMLLDEAQVAHVLDAILQLRSDNVHAALKKAVADNTIAGIDIDAAACTLHSLRIAHIAARPFRGGKTPFRDVLATTIPDPLAQTRVCEAFAAHGTRAAFWTELATSEGFTVEALADLRFTLGAAVLLRNHLPLLQHVQKLRADQSIASTRDLARLDEEDWGKLLRETDPEGAHITFTANLNFRTLDERIDHFAQILAAQFERRHPTAAFAGRLAKDHGGLQLAAPQGVQRFLDSNRSFSLRRTHIDRFLQDNGGSTLGATDVAAQVVADLKKIQRVCKLTPRFVHVKAMLSAGHTSAQSIYAAGRKRVVETLTAAGATGSEARAIYARAEQAHATTLALLGNYNSAFTSVAPSAVARPPAAAALQPMLAGFPNLQSLFGANDYCSCQHCRSMHGPAAYLVDMLQFLKHRTATVGTAREVLLARRPDLGVIELSCDNTNGVMPYIDLVCEVLEDAVSAPSQAAVRARQTSGSPEELRANPRFVNEAAYTTLRSAVFPHAAPFDLWTAEVRAFLRQLGVPWHDLLAAFQVPGAGATAASPTDTQIAGERLGFNTNALTLVTTAAPAQPWTHWGLQEINNSVPDPRKPSDATAIVTGTWLQVLGFVPILLHRAGLRHRELIQLLATRFINPTGAIKIVETSADGFASCDTGRQTVVTWTADALSRFNQFVRLWRQLGCTIWDLDKVLTTTAVGNNAIDAMAIAQLGRFEQIAGRLGIARDEVLGLWSDVDRFNYLNVLDDGEVVMKSVYARRFRNATVTQSSSVFVEDPAALQGPLGSAEAIAGIAAALNLSADDIQRIRAATGLSAATVPLNLTNLSVLFRYAILAGALRLTIADLVIAIAVAGVNPFTSPAKTVEFLDAFDQVRNSGFTLPELHYLLRHGSALDSGIALADSTIAEWLDDLRKGMVRLDSGRADFVVRRISDLLTLDPVLTAQAMQATLPGAASSIAALFTDARLTQRAEDGSFVTPSNRASFGGIFDAFVVLDKMHTVLARWRVSTRDAAWLLERAGLVGWLELRTLPASATAAPVALSKLDVLRTIIVMQQTLVAANESRLFDVVMQRNSPRNVVASALAALGGWSSADVIALANRFGWATGATLVTNANAPRIRDLMAWPRRLGTDIAETLTFVTTSVTTAEARKARQLTKAKYDLDKWYAIAGSIQDGLREQKRAALVAWLLANPDAARGQRWVNVEELYGFHLIDPEMAPCATTTRIKQAAASVQLFVQRCFLQREPGVSVNNDADDGWSQWEWMKRFRLWEANRKIFLYPENWIDPSRRRAKSPFFSELENELQQSDVTQEAAEDALRQYLQKLSGVSHLEICGVSQQFDYGRRLLHVVGRTRTTPHVHYYRRLGSTGVWSPWERLDVEINTEHVMPVFWNRRLYVFWPEFVEKSLPPSAASRTVPSTGGGTAAEPGTYWEIALASSERGRDGWTAKRLARLKQLTTYPRLDKRWIAFKAPTVGRSLQVDIYMGYAQSTPVHAAQWQLTSGEDEPILLNAGLNLGAVDGASDIGTLTREQQKPSLLISNSLDWHYNGQRGGSPGTIGPLELLQGSPPQHLTVLGRIAQPRVMMGHQEPQFLSQSPFFVSDPRRTFFMVPHQFTIGGSRSGGTPVAITEYSPAIFYHPFVGTFMQELAFGGLDGLYNRRLQTNPDVVRGPAPFNFAAEYQPANVVRPRSAPEPPYPTETVDYSHDGAYASYNWELFFHVPLLVAQRLAHHQRFDDARRWFHYIFNPTATSGGNAPQRYWIPRVFHDLTAEDYARQQIERLLRLISEGDAELEAKIAAWRSDPFDPHLIAASRPVAYQKAIVMQYVAMLIAWGDQLFRGDTIESINEATQLYMMASELLGPRPQNLRALQPRQAKTYNDLAPQLDDFSNALVDIENVISIPPAMGPSGSTPLPQLHTFYFCVPPNEKLLACWDTVADRLFKIRNCLNLDGVARPLALYEPAIDPGLLARATAAGVDLATALTDVDVAQPCYRFTTVWQRAYDLCQDVRSLGASILSALERRDAEQLSRVRSAQEAALLDAIRAVKTDQLAEAVAHQAALRTSKEAAGVRRDYYSSRDFMNAGEIAGLRLSGLGLLMEGVATIADMTATAAFTLPTTTVGVSGWGGTPTVKVTHGGGSIGNSAKSAASLARGLATVLNHGAGLANTYASYQRRSEDWDLQRRIADKEIEQFDRQLLAADIRIAAAGKELKNHGQQVDDARAMSELLESKFTNRELYDWTLSQLSTTYFQAYQLAYDLAKRASKAYAFEIGTDPGYIQFGYWDSLHKGLHAGDKLLLDLRRLQAEHLHRNRRELELTKHVSLAQVDPIALVKLRQTGECFINLPESLFDLDQPGHYMRRLKSVSVTLPCVTGPYTGINATLTLVSHATRRSEIPGDQYLPAVDADGIPLETDTRFSRGAGAIQSVALSTGREDGGLFEVNFHDERYLPFEGLGAISHWRLELPKDCNRFDVSTLSDVVMHLRYTARDGGPTLRTAARQAVVAALPHSGTRLLSARSEFGDAWARLWSPTGSGQRLELALGKEHFPYLASNHRLKVSAVAAFLLFDGDKTYADYQSAGAASRLKVRMGFSTTDGSPPATSTTFTPDPNVGQLPVAALALAGDVGPVSLAFLETDLAACPLLDHVQTAPDGTPHHRLNRERIDDVLILVSYKIEAQP
jgi:hypothetical protein